MIYDNDPHAIRYDTCSCGIIGHDAPEYPDIEASIASCDRIKIETATFSRKHKNRLTQKQVSE